VADKVSKRPFEPKSGIGPRAVQFAEEEGLIVRSLAGDVITLCPPLVISVEEIDLLFERLGRALDRALDWAKQQRLI
jgi:4-aminobutyrate--pyruvate transaminase